MAATTTAQHYVPASVTLADPSSSSSSPIFPGSFIQLIPSAHYKPPPKRVCNPWLSYKNDLATRYPEVCTLERAPSQRMRIAARLWECESPSVKAEYEKRYQVALRAAGVKGAELDLNRRRVRSEGVTAARRAKRATEGATLSPRSTFLVNAWIGGARGAALIRAVTDWDSANGAEPVSKRKKKGAVSKSAEVSKKNSTEQRTQPPPPPVEPSQPPSPAAVFQSAAVVKPRVPAVVARAHGPAFGQWVPSPIPLRLTSHHLSMPVSMPSPLGYPTFAAEWPSPGSMPELVYADSPASFSMPSPVFAHSPAASSAYTSSPALSHKSPVFFTDSPMAMEYSPAMLEGYSPSLFDSSFDDTTHILPLLDATNAGAWA